LDSRGQSPDGEDLNSTSAKSDLPKSPNKNKDDVVIEDLGDEPINLDDIPF
jgi:hypothetical protein